MLDLLEFSTPTLNQLFGREDRITKKFGRLYVVLLELAGKIGRRVNIIFTFQFESKVSENIAKSVVLCNNRNCRMPIN